MIVVMLVTLALPYSPLRELLGFRPLAVSSLILLGFITLLYVATSEIAKRIFYSKVIKRVTQNVNQYPSAAIQIQGASQLN
jgi:hypothetical protein